LIGLIASSVGKSESSFQSQARPKVASMHSKPTELYRHRFCALSLRKSLGYEATTSIVMPLPSWPKSSAARARSWVEWACASRSQWPAARPCGLSIQQQLQGRRVSLDPLALHATWGVPGHWGIERKRHGLLLLTGHGGILLQCAFRGSGPQLCSNINCIPRFASARLCRIPFPAKAWYCLPPQLHPETPMTLPALPSATTHPSVSLHPQRDLLQSLLNPTPLGLSRPQPTDSRQTQP
jgi:hypothetical protein